MQPWGLLVWVVVWVYWLAIGVLCGAAWAGLFPKAVMDWIAAFARRGKPVSSDAGGHWLRKLQVPHQWFTHFYILGASCTVTFLGYAALHPTEEGSYRQGILVVGLLAIHTVRRLAECLCVSSFDSRAKMHVAAYLFGVSYYAMLTPTFLLANGWRPSSPQRQLDMSRFEPASPQGLHMLQVAGAAVFAFGSWHQNRCHRILAALRFKDDLKATPRYGIPRGDWFERVSCPHYTAEVVLYVGLGVASFGTLSRYADGEPLEFATVLLPCAVLVAVTTNLGFAAGLTHRWYLSHLSGYPKDRFAFIPWLY